MRVSTLEFIHGSEEIEQQGVAAFLADVDGVLVAPGFGARGTEGKIAAVRFARDSTRKQAVA